MKFLGKHLTRKLTACAALLFTAAAWSAEADIGPVYLQWVGVIAVPSATHQAGNLEIEVKGGFQVPSGLACTSPYITTLKSTDADRRLFTLLALAHSTNKAVRLRITDAADRTAFSGRCSLVWVVLDS